MSALFASDDTSFTVFVSSTLVLWHKGPAYYKGKWMIQNGYSKCRYKWIDIRIAEDFIKRRGAPNFLQS